MLTRVLVVVVSLTLGIVGAWAKAAPLDPVALMTKSDALYYYPTAHGVTDLAVEVHIDQLADHPTGKRAHVQYYYAGEKRQMFAVTDLSDNETKLRSEILAMVAPLADYLMPRPSMASFEGLTLKVATVSREILGLSGTTFYEVVGTAKAANADVKEYRVLLGEDGQAYQVENVLKDGTVVAARLENVRVADSWHISKVISRLTANVGPVWKIDSVEYGQIEGYVLPTRVTVQYRNGYNQPVRGFTDLTVQFRNYRLNKGVAAAAVPAPQPAPPASAPTAPVPPAK